MNAKSRTVKDSLKELAPAYIVSFVLCYMLFFFEPLNTYASNMLNFNYDLKTYIFPILGLFGTFFIGLAVIFWAVYFICRKFNKMMPYKILTVTIIFLFFPLYIQNTFLNSVLPVLDGSPIIWNDYIHLDFYWLLFTVCLSAIFIYCIIKFGIDKILKYSSLITLAVFVMLTAGLIATISENSALKSRNNIITTNENFNTMSYEKNFVIFVVDTVSAGAFDEILSENQKYTDVFEDFTFYTDVMSVYPYTTYSIPLILTGQTSKSESEYEDFCTNAYNNSPLFSALNERDYNINLYEENLYWMGERNFDIQNGDSIYGYDVKFGGFSDQLRYLWFKFVPYTLKRFADIESVDFKFGTIIRSDAFSWKNDSFYEMVKENPDIEKQQRNNFQFIHIEGAHKPFIYDENVNKVEEGTSYSDSVKATITTIKAYIDRLKANGIYDNTAIVIVADHGNTDADEEQSIDLLSRLNPILLIKGINEKHELIRSDLPLIQTDLIDVYSQLLDEKQSTDLFTDIGKSRTRTVLIHTNEYIFTEYTTDGKATEYNKFIPTGNVYENAE
ncbi:MAG: sulfatase-like hydrolase/transferase [Oscillospiraceae bacterium]|nr:sulfatase-like hydrolase/transferase [Oscillospiraceae bacterium]